MSAPGNPQTPNEKLAAIIADALQRAGLVPEALVAEMQQKLAAGSAREVDWRAWIAAACPDAGWEEARG